MNQGIFALFKGESGAGKTVAAASWPDPIILDHDEKGPAIIRKHFPGKNIPYQQFKDVLQVGELLQRWDNEGCPFETIIADSITSLSQACIKTMDDQKNTNILEKLKALKGAKKQVELRGFDYYNVENDFLKFYLDSLKILWKKPGKPYNIIVIAHVLASEQRNMATKEVIQTRQIVTAGQKIGAYIPAQFDDAWHVGVQGSNSFDGAQVKHLVFTEAIGDDFAKTAFRLPQKIDFTNASLYDLVKDKLSVEPKEEPRAKPRLSF